MTRTRNAKYAVERERLTAMHVDHFIKIVSLNYGKITDSDLEVLSRDTLSAMDLARLSGLLPLVASINRDALNKGYLSNLAHLLIALNLPLVSRPPTLADRNLSHNWTPAVPTVAVRRAETPP